MIEVSLSDETSYGNKAIDKNLATYAAVKFVDEKSTPELWMNFKLIETRLIYKIVIYQIFLTGWYHPTSWCAKSKANYEACKDKQGNVDVSVYQGEVQQKSCGTLSPTYGPEPSDQIYTFICSVEGAAVVVSKNKRTLRVDEIVIVGGRGLSANSKSSKNLTRKNFET